MMSWRAKSISGPAAAIAVSLLVLLPMVLAWQLIVQITAIRAASTVVVLTVAVVSFWRCWREGGSRRT